MSEVADQPPEIEISSFNYHVVKECNMHCHFCFGTFKDVSRSMLPEGSLKLQDSLELIRQLGEVGFKKANFAGGEPFLHAGLPELVDAAKQQNMVTSVVTNGSLLLDGAGNVREDALDDFENLDWFAISIDSIVPNTLIESGRVVGRNPAMTAEQYLSIISLAKSRGMGVKINTTVHSGNRNEDILPFVKAAAPDRWKVMRMLPVSGQRPDRLVAKYAISGADFAEYQLRHESRAEESGVDTVFEDNDDMAGSYVMIDPAGRFFDNFDAAEGGAYKYSDPILEVGVPTALDQIRLAPDRFMKRDGDYYVRSNQEPLGHEIADAPLPIFPAALSSLARRTLTRYQDPAQLTQVAFCSR